MTNCKGVEMDIFFKRCPFRFYCKRYSDWKNSPYLFTPIPYNDEYKYCKQFIYNNKKDK